MRLAKGIVSAVKHVFFHSGGRNCCLLAEQRECLLLSVYNRRYEKTLGSKAEVLRAFAKLDTPLQHDKYLEALHCESRFSCGCFCVVKRITASWIMSFLFCRSCSDECELRQQIKKLQEYRANGITTHRGASVYDKLKTNREVNKRRGSILSDVLAHVQVS